MDSYQKTRWRPSLLFHTAPLKIVFFSCRMKKGRNDEAFFFFKVIWKPEKDKNLETQLWSREREKCWVYSANPWWGGLGMSLKHEWEKKLIQISQFSFTQWVVKPQYRHCWLKLSAPPKEGEKNVPGESACANQFSPALSFCFGAPSAVACCADIS